MWPQDICKGRACGLIKKTIQARRTSEYNENWDQRIVIEIDMFEEVWGQGAQLSSLLQLFDAQVVFTDIYGMRI